MDRAPMDDEKKPSQNDHETRITALERAMTGVEAEIRQLRQHMNDGFALLRDSIGDLAKRMDRQEARMDRLEGKVDRLEGKVERVGTRIDTRFDQMSSLLRWAVGLLIAVLLAVLGAGISLVGLLVHRMM